MDPNQPPIIPPVGQPPMSPPQPSLNSTPPSVGPAGEDPGKTLAIVGVVLAFFFALVGLVVSIVAKNKSKAAGFNNTLATVGIWLNASFMILGVLITIFWFVVIASAITTSNNELTKMNTERDKESSEILNAKKDFAKGETAKFGKLDVTVNKVQRNYMPTNRFSAPAEGKEFIIINVTIKNSSDESKYISASTLQLNVGGVSEYSTYVSGLKQLEGGNLSSGASITGDLAFEVTKDASGLKLQYEETAFVTTDGKFNSKKLTYTLAI